jgi:hypothetical protein
MTSSLSPGVFNHGLTANGVELTVGSTSDVVDLTGSVQISLDPDVHAQFLTGTVSVVPMRIHEHKSDGVGDKVGPITVRTDPDRVPPDSTITAVASGQPFPAVHDMVVNIHVTIPNLLPGITLRNQIPPNPGPAILRNSSVTNFPPQNDVYALVEPIDLEDVNNPGPVLATIQSFPVTVNPAY